MLSETRQDMLRTLLKDPNIAGCLLQEGEVFHILTINDDGSIVLGRTKSRWYNRFFNSEHRIDFMTLTLLISQKISGAKELDDNNMFAGLSREVLKQAFLNKNEDYIVDALFDTVRMLCDGPLKSNYSKLDNNKAEPRNTQTKKVYMPQHGQSSRILGQGKASIQMPSGDVLLDDITITMEQFQ